jgi:hypothetical protein
LRWASIGPNTAPVLGAPDTGLRGLTILGALPERGAWSAWSAATAAGQAVEVLALLPSLDPQLRQRERERLRLLPLIRQADLLPVLAAGTAPDGRRFVVAAVSHGPTLEDWVGRHGALGPAMAVGLVRRLALALEPAHRSGVIHRALSAAMVHLDRAEREPRDPFPFAVRLAGLGQAADPGDEGRDDPREDLGGLAAILVTALGGSTACPPATPAPVRALHGWLVQPEQSTPVGCRAVVTRCDAVAVQVAPAWRFARRGLFLLIILLALLAWWQLR